MSLDPVMDDAPWKEREGGGSVDVVRTEKNDERRAAPCTDVQSETDKYASRVNATISSAHRFDQSSILTADEVK